MIERKKKHCSCGAERDRPGQAQCKACHKVYMQQQRAKSVSVPKAWFDDIVAMGLGPEKARA